MKLLICSLALLAGYQEAVRLAEAHGTMIDPVSRNSLWRIDQTAPVNYNDIELFCGGIGVLSANGNRCGVCGDPYPAPRPRAHETGGHMVMNKTVKNYFPGSTIDVMIDLDTNHGGYFQFELCRRESLDEMEQEECFERLRFVDGTYRKQLQTDHSAHGLMGMSLMMPDDLRECRACILRWNYVAGNNWGICPDGTAGTGCGPQELYRNCADISIGYLNYFKSSDSDNLQPANRLSFASSQVRPIQSNDVESA